MGTPIKQLNLPGECSWCPVSQDKLGSTRILCCGSSNTQLTLLDCNLCQTDSSKTFTKRCVISLGSTGGHKTGSFSEGSATIGGTGKGVDHSGAEFDETFISEDSSRLDNRRLPLIHWGECYNMCQYPLGLIAVVVTTPRVQGGTGGSSLFVVDPSSESSVAVTRLPETVTCVRMGGTHKVLLGTKKCSVFLYDMSTDTLERLTMSGGDNNGRGALGETSVTSVDWNRSNKDVALAGTSDGRGYVYRIGNTRPITPSVKFRDASGRWMSSMRFLPGTTGIVATFDDDVNPGAQVWDMRNLNFPFKELSGSNIFHRGIVTLEVCPQDSSIFTVGTRDGRAISVHISSQTQGLTAMSEFCFGDPIRCLSYASSPYDGIVAISSTSSANNHTIVLADIMSTVVPGTMPVIPKWMRSKLQSSSIAFGFGGRMAVSVNEPEDKGTPEISVVRMEKGQSESFKQALDSFDALLNPQINPGQILELCGAAKDVALTDPATGQCLVPEFDSEEELADLSARAAMDEALSWTIMQLYLHCADFATVGRPVDEVEREIKTGIAQLLCGLSMDNLQARAGEILNKGRRLGELTDLLVRRMRGNQQQHQQQQQQQLIDFPQAQAHLTLPGSGGSYRQSLPSSQELGPYSMSGNENTGLGQGDLDSLLAQDAKPQLYEMNYGVSQSPENEEQFQDQAETKPHSVGPASPPQPPSEGGSKAVNFLKAATDNSPVAELIKDFYILGQLEYALELSLLGGRIADALLISKQMAGPMWWDMVVDFHANKEMIMASDRGLFSSLHESSLRGQGPSVGLSNFVCYGVSQQFETFVDMFSDLGRWKDAIVFLSNFALKMNDIPNTFGHLCRRLGNRIECERLDTRAAALCYVCGRDFQDAVQNWCKVPLLGRLQNATANEQLANVVFRMCLWFKATGHTVSGGRPNSEGEKLFVEKIIRISEIMASCGKFISAMNLLQLLGPQADTLYPQLNLVKSRIFNAENPEIMVANRISQPSGKQYIELPKAITQQQMPLGSLSALNVVPPTAGQPTVTTTASNAAIVNQPVPPFSPAPSIIMPTTSGQQAAYQQQHTQRQGPPLPPPMGATGAVGQMQHGPGPVGQMQHGLGPVAQMQHGPGPVGQMQHGMPQGPPLPAPPGPTHRAGPPPIPGRGGPVPMGMMPQAPVPGTVGPPPPPSSWNQPPMMHGANPAMYGRQ